MRRKYFGWAIAAVALLGPQTASAGDREIAQQIIERLKVNRSAGQLKDFKFDMKVNDGVVLFRGSVSEDRQRDLVLAAADGIDGISNVVDQIAVTAIQAAAEPTTETIGPVAGVALTESPAPAAESGFDMAGALATAAAEIAAESTDSSIEMPIVNGDDMVRPVAAFEDNTDSQIVQEILASLGEAQQSGQLRGFGVDVQCNDGTVDVAGRAKSAVQREQIMTIVRETPGVMAIRENIDLVGQSTGGAAPMVDPPAAAPRPMPSQPIQAQTVANTSAARMAPRPMAQTAPYRMNQAQPMRAMPAAHAGAVVGTPIGGVTGTPVPMAPYAAPGAPRYDTPNLPNYAWPGYAAHPNYAAVTYPQQYSPSAWPYIGPFYPYPQVPLGWRKVSLEWDDGWWFLDFTDRDY